MKKILLLSAVFLFAVVFSQNKENTSYYEAKLDNKKTVSLYLNIMVNECSEENFYQGMYKFSDTEKWVYLNIQTNPQQEFLMSEHHIGVLMILKKSGEKLDGIYMKLKDRKQQPIHFIKKKQKDMVMKKLLDQLDELTHELFDC